MKKLVVLTYMYEYHNPNITESGLIKFLSEKELKITDVKIHSYRELNLKIKEKSIVIHSYLNGTITFDLNDTETTYLIFTGEFRSRNNIRSKSVPNNVIVITDKLYSKQKDGVGNIYHVDDHYGPFDMFGRSLQGMIKSNLVSTKSKLIAKLEKILDIDRYSSELYTLLHNYCLERLFIDRELAYHKSTIKLIDGTIERLINTKPNYFSYAGGCYTALNNAIRNNKMKIDNSLSYNGFKYLDKLFDKHINSNRISNSNIYEIKKFLSGFITVMIADELGSYLKYPKTKENTNKILYINDKTDFYFKDVLKVMPHMERYIGYLNTYPYITEPSLYIFRNHYDNVAEKILDTLTNSKELNDRILFNVNYILDNNAFTMSNLS